MKKEIVTYEASGIKLKGYLVYDESIREKRPAVIVAHAWRGQDDFARKKAEELARLGYIGFAADLYGDGISVNTNEEAEALMKPLFADRKTLQERILAAFNFISNYEGTDKDRIGTIGFCFGGLTAIELFRSGAPVRGVVSFHGLLGGFTLPIENNIKGSLLVLHGYNDPLVSQNEITDFQKEMDKAGVDWEMNIYSKTSHAFTNPEANDTKLGLIYNATSAHRSWQSMQQFFKEIFK